MCVRKVIGSRTPILRKWEEEDRGRKKKEEERKWERKKIESCYWDETIREHEVLHFLLPSLFSVSLLLFLFSLSLLFLSFFRREHFLRRKFFFALFFPFTCLTRDERRILLPEWFLSPHLFIIDEKFFLFFPPSLHFLHLFSSSQNERGKRCSFSEPVFPSEKIMISDFHSIAKWLLLSALFPLDLKLGHQDDSSCQIINTNWLSN